MLLKKIERGCSGMGKPLLFIYINGKRYFTIKGKIDESPFPYMIYRGLKYLRYILAKKERQI